MYLRGVTLIRESDSKIVIKKRKRVALGDMAYSVVVPIATVLIFVLFMVLTGHLPDDPGFGFYCAIVVVSSIISIGIATNIIEVSINGRDFVLEKSGDTIRINTKAIQLTGEECIVIKGQTGSEGFGKSFIVGIKGEKLYPLVFYQEDEGAKHIAGILSEFLELKIILQKSRGISILNWH